MIEAIALRINGCLYRKALLHSTILLYHLTLPLRSVTILVHRYTSLLDHNALRMDRVTLRIDQVTLLLHRVTLRLQGRVPLMSCPYLAETELRANLIDIYETLTSGAIPNVRRVAELEVSCY
ncbi:MAG: hypothetical protein KME45_30130 [Stenomitos rutilans HA7619-LM2]|nr:hypothetical protein [Stenomitos rutilans HA7619-LM2]